MKILMTLMLALLLSGCGKKAEVGSETSVEMSYSNYEALTTNTPTDLPPTVVLIAENISGIKLVKSIQENFNFNLPNGVWKFYVMSWNYATPSNGGAPFRLDVYAYMSSLFCGFQNAINLTGQPVTIQMSLTKANCTNEDSNLTLGRFWFKETTTPPANTPLRYVLWSIVGYNELTGENDGEIFRSSCKVMNSDIALSPTLPLPKQDLPIKLKFKLVVRFFLNDSCSPNSLQYSIFYSNSLRTNPIAIRHVANPPDLSIQLNSNIGYEGGTIILNSSTPTSNPNLSVAEASTDDSTN